VLVAPIAKRQAAAGYHVEFASGTGEYLPDLRALGFPVTVLPVTRRLLRPSHVTTVLALYRLMSQGRFQVVHTHTPVVSFLARIAATAARVPIVIYHMRGAWWESPDTASAVKAGFTAAEWFAGRCLRTSHIFTLNDSDTRHIIEKRIVASGEVTCLHSGAGGVDASRFDASAIGDDTRRRVRAELGIDAASPVFGFVGRMVARKGILELADAFERVAREIDSARLIMVGGLLASERDRDTLTALEQKVAASDVLRDRVVLTGMRKDVPELLAVCDVAVVPSRFEPFGMTMAEAGSMGLPVIAADTQGAREVIVPGSNGTIVPVGDVDALSDAMLTLARAPDLRRAQGEAGRRRVLEHFDEPVIQARIEAVYRRLLAAAGP